MNLREARGPHRGDKMDESGVDWDDEEIIEFVRGLDSRLELDLTDWEAQFVESNMSRIGDYHFSEKQRVVIKKLHQKYGDIPNR
jgi:hypothetical protein